MPKAVVLNPVDCSGSYLVMNSGKPSRYPVKQWFRSVGWITILTWICPAIKRSRILVCIETLFKSSLKTDLLFYFLTFPTLLLSFFFPLPSSTSSAFFVFPGSVPQNSGCPSLEYVLNWELFFSVQKQVVSQSCRRSTTGSQCWVNIMENDDNF